MTALRKFTIKLVLLLFTFYILHFTFLTPVHAQTQPSTSKVGSDSFEVSQAIPSIIPPTSPIFTDLLMQNVFHTFSCLAVGSSIISQPCLTYISGVPVLSKANLSGGALGVTTSLIGMLYVNPPVRTVNYLASVGENLGLVKTAHAQVIGSGAGVLSPILSLWQVSRNISYLIMIIIFVIIGLMVMFRQRINPQTVITAQAALPGLVIGLILITFSYFLAALLTDTAYVGTNLVGYYFAAAQGKTDDPTRLNLVKQMADSGENVLKTFSRFTFIVDHGSASNALDAIWDNLGTTAKGALTALAVFFAMQTTSQATEVFKAIPEIGQGIQAAIVAISGIGAAAAPVGLATSVLWFIAAIILLYAMFRLLYRLIIAYLNIIFLTVSAPFQFLAASLPGRQGTATHWIRKMLANVLIFPAVIAVFYFAAFMYGAKTDLGPFTVASTVEVAGTNTFPLFGGINLSLLKILLVFGTLVALPTIPDLIVKSLGGESQAGQALGGGIMAMVGAGRGYANQAQGAIGAASSQGARLRSFADTPGYQFNPATKGMDKLTPQNAISQDDLFRAGYQPGKRKKMGF